MDLVHDLRQLLAAEADVQTAWLFGSRARGTHRHDSDIDIAVLFSNEVEDLRRFDLQTRLCIALGMPVQIVPVRRAAADLVRRVLRDGQLLLDRNRANRVAFEVKKRIEYFDMTPIWRTIRRLPPGVAP